MHRISPEEYKKKTKLPLTLVLDNVRSGLNVGSAFRTADAFALEQIILCGITVQPPHREILKTAIGATESIDWRYVEQTEEAIAFLRQDGYRIMAVEQAHGSTPLQKAEVNKGEKIALIFGNEVSGVRQSVMDQVEECIELPQFGTKHSLNISVCLGIVVWELFKQFKWDHK